MTSPRRFESDLPALLADLYLAGTPDYRDDLVQQTARVRQRPAWTFPERWLPVELVTSRVPTTRMPWRQLGVLALIALLLAAALAVYIGSQTPKLPPPFGPAGNGLIAYSKDGDIFTVDPRSGAIKAIVTGPEIDQEPTFSPDGTRLDFFRKRSDGKYDLVVAKSDGSGARIVTTEPMPDGAVAQFTADGAALIVPGQTTVERVDLASSTPPQPIAIGRFVAGTVRATDGAILFENDESPGIDLWIMDADGSDKRLLWDPHLDGDYSDIQQYRWSPDGTMIAFTCSDFTTHEGTFICVMDQDGTGIRRLTTNAGDWVENDLKWSPDGEHIAFNRWHKVDDAWLIQPIGVVSKDGGAVTSLGDAPVSEGALFDYSPDGESILAVPGPYLGSQVGLHAIKPASIDVATGLQTEFSFDVFSNVSWQRIAR